MVDPGSSMTVGDAPAIVSRSIVQRIFDWLFGRDFFISYRWEDGRVYASGLARRLKAARFDCFLDSEGFLKGDNWRHIGARELRKTSRLVLVGSPGAHASEPIAHELRIFGRTGRRVIAIEFGDSLSPEKHPESRILPLLDPAAIREVESPARLAEGPSDHVVHELQRAFTGDTTATRRLRVIQSALVVLTVLTLAALIAGGVAYTQYRTNLFRSARSDAQRAAADADRGDYVSTVAFFARSLAQNPDDPAVANALLRLTLEHPPVAAQTIARGVFNGARISADGTVLLVLAREGAVLAGPPEAAALPLSLGGRQVNQIALAPGGRIAALAAAREVALVDLATRQAGGWRTLAKEITALRLRDSGELAVGDNEGGVTVIRAGAEDWVAPEPLGNPIAQLTFLDPPLWLAAVDEHKHQRVWQDGKRLCFEDLEADSIDGVFFAPTGVRGVAYAQGGGPAGTGLMSSITLYRYRPPADPAPATDAESLAAPWERTFDSRNHELLFIRALSAAPTGSAYMALMSSGEVEIGGDQRQEIILGEAGVTAYAATPDLGRVVTAHLDGTVRSWDGATGFPLAPAVFAPRGVTHLAAANDGATVVALSENEVIAYRFPSVHPPETVQGDAAAAAPEPPASFRRLGVRGPVATADRRQVFAVAGATPGTWRVKGAAGEQPFVHELTGDEQASADSILENEGIDSSPAATLSPDGKLLATSAAAQPVRIWEVGGNRRPRCELTSPFPLAYPSAVVFSPRGDRAFISYGRSSYVVFDTRSGAVASRPVTLYENEKFWDVSPDLSYVLVSTGRGVRVQTAQDGEVIVGSLPIDAEVRAAGFVANGATFYAATRDGWFRAWRTIDGMALSGRVVFDPAPAPNRGAPQDDSYLFTVWAEDAAGGAGGLRRMAFRIDNDNSGKDQAPVLRTFDLGASGSRNDRLRFAGLVEKLYGVRLSPLGNLAHRAPASAAELAADRDAHAWDTPDFRAAAEWLLSSRFEGHVSPYAPRPKK